MSCHAIEHQKLKYYLKETCKLSTLYSDFEMKGTFQRCKRGCLSKAEVHAIDIIIIMNCSLYFCSHNVVHQPKRVIFSPSNTILLT